MPRLTGVVSSSCLVVDVLSQLVVRGSAGVVAGVPRLVSRCVPGSRTVTRGMLWSFGGADCFTGVLICNAVGIFGLAGVIVKVILALGW